MTICLLSLNFACFVILVFVRHLSRDDVSLFRFNFLFFIFNIYYFSFYYHFFLLYIFLSPFDIYTVFELIYNHLEHVAANHASIYIFVRQFIRQNDRKVDRHQV
jgi:hypothetical protein